MESMLIAPEGAVVQDDSFTTFERQLLRDIAPGSAVPSRPRARPHLAPWQVKLACKIMAEEGRGGLVLSDVADRLGMSVSHFIKAFGETQGISPYQWYMQQRITQATILLADGDIPLSKVADACGFADQSHFTKAFTRVLGISPGRWRRHLHSGGPFGPEDAPSLGAPIVENHAPLRE